MLQVRGLALAFPPDEEIFNNITFTVSTQPLGLVGPNGSGKSSLLRLIAGQIAPSAGQIVRDDRPIHWVSQNMSNPCDSRSSPSHSFGSTSRLFDAYRAWDSGCCEPGERVYLDQNWDRMRRIQTQLDLWQVSEILGNGKNIAFNHGSIQRLRLALAFADSEALLLLDEPSNHLDTYARNALYRAIGNHASGCLIASHDRRLLEHVDRIIEIGAHGIIPYGGNYSFYRESKEAGELNRKSDWEESKRVLRAAKLKAQQTFEKQAKRSEHANVNKHKSGLPKILVGTRKRGAQESEARLKHQHAGKIRNLDLDFKEASQAYIQVSEVQIDLSGSDPIQSGTILSVKELNHSFTRADQPLWKNPLHFDIQAGERWALIGRNGVGKSTLLKIILGDIIPQSGQVRSRAKVTALLDQELKSLPAGESLSSTWQDSRFHPDESLKRTIAARLGLNATKVRERFDHLSGGQRLRAALVLISSQRLKPDLILLDEPSNHLDLDTLRCLTQTLKTLACSLIVVSHDEQFIADLNLDHCMELI